MFRRRTVQVLAQDTADVRHRWWRLCGRSPDGRRPLATAEERMPRLSDLPEAPEPEAPEPESAEPVSSVVWPSRIRRGHVVGVAALLTLAVVGAGVLMLRHRPVTEPLPAPSPASGALGPSALPGARTEQVSPAQTARTAADPPATASVLLVHVAGKVRKPGVVELPAGARVLDAVRKAGGAKPGVDLSTLNLARPVTDGEQILVGVPGSPIGPAEAQAPPAGPDAPPSPLHLNQATPGQLEELPGIGPVLAQRIIEARDERGGFRTVEELLEVSGIAERRFAELRDRVTVP